MQNTAFRSHNKVFFVTGNGIFQQSCRRSNLVGQFGNGSFTFGMNQNSSVRILFFQLQYFLHRELFVHMAGTIPKQHIASCNRIDIITQISIRTENNLFICRKTFYDLLGISRSDHHIGHRFNSRCSVNIRNHCIIRMLLDKFSKLISRTTVGQ